MAQNVTIQGATYSAVPAVELPKQGGGTATFTDVTDTTATASDVASGTYFYTAAGVRTEGTASGGGGGGSITQDADGYLVLDPNGGGGGGSGLEYEEGTWTPTQDVSSYVISFAGTHSVAPYCFMIVDATGTYDSTTNSVYYLAYDNFHQAFGVPQDINNDGTYVYGYVYRRWKNSATSTTGGVFMLQTPYTDSADSLNTESRYWATETGIKANSANSQYFLANRTYKWIAVWTPQS